MIVVGSALAKVGDHLVAGVRESIYARTLPALSSSLRIVGSDSSDKAALAGAAVRATEAMFSAAGPGAPRGDPVQEVGVGEVVGRQAGQEQRKQAEHPGSFPSGQCWSHHLLLETERADRGGLRGWLLRAPTVTVGQFRALKPPRRQNSAPGPGPDPGHVTPRTLAHGRQRPGPRVRRHSRSLRSTAFAGYPGLVEQ